MREGPLIAVLWPSSPSFEPKLRCTYTLRPCVYDTPLAVHPQPSLRNTWPRHHAAEQIDISRRNGSEQGVGEPVSASRHLVWDTLREPPLVDFPQSGICNPPQVCIVARIQLCLLIHIDLSLPLLGTEVPAAPADQPEAGYLFAEQNPEPRYE